MGHPTEPAAALPLLAVFSRYDEALDWVRGRVEAALGPLALESDTFRFDDTDYYESTMGPGSEQAVHRAGELIDPGELAALKLQANAWEAEYAAAADHAEPRPLNIDPGYLARGKLVLASTKDHAHRIYLGQGIYGEVTLYLKHGAWRHHEWTFPDYRRADYHAFLTRCHEHLRARLAEGR